MSKKWDSNKGGRDQWIVWLAEIMREARRVIRPGGHALVWALPRTAHWTAMALENAGWECRDIIHHIYSADTSLQNFLASLTKEQQEAFECLVDSQASSTLYHLFGSGFPKSIAANKKVEAEIISQFQAQGIEFTGWEDEGELNYTTNDELVQVTVQVYGKSITLTKRNGKFIKPPELQRLEGTGSALKPAAEHWILARAPLAEPTIAANVLKYGTGALNIDACRVTYANEKDAEPKDYTKSKGIETYQESCKEQGARKYTDGFSYLKNDFVAQTPTQGRWPANLLLSHTLFCTEDECTEDCPVLMLDQQSGVIKGSPGMRRTNGKPKFNGRYNNGEAYLNKYDQYFGYNDTGGASRFFQQFYYCPKASQAERNFGCDDLLERNGFDKNTSKNIAHINHEAGNTTYTEYTPSVNKNHHPTVKPIMLLRYLARLITPNSGTVLDMFAGSGSTGVAAILEGFNFILIEQEAEYIEIIQARIAATRRT